MKILGGILIVLGGFGIGKSYCKNLRLRYENLKELLECIRHLEGEIRYANKPLTEIFEGIRKKRPEIFGTFFGNVAEELSKMTGNTFPEIWSMQLDISGKNIVLQKEDWGALKDFGKTLGIMDVTMQLKQLEFYMERLKNSIEEAREQWKEKERLVPKLGLVSGMAVVLILI